MPSKKSILLKSQGFTLVELLIVVAIIGVLASQGVPAYRRMIMKSRKGEAQVMLGNIATVESAFFSEYGSYGDHLARMGAVMEGTQFIYAGAINNAACLPLETGFFPALATIPALGNNPGYFLPLPPAAGLINLQRGNRVGRDSQTICLPGTGAFALAAPGIVYRASATGFIRGGTAAERNACGAGLPDCDQWTIDQNRNLVNFVDGIN